MAIIIDPPNSIWPNGLKVDSEGYVTFYPMGTNKVDINTITWPDGDKLVSPFVYQNDKLVGFVDTKALTISDNTLIYLPYTHIEAEFSAIDKGQLQIHAPNATTKKASWKDSGVEDIPEAQFKYKNCATIDDVKVVDDNYKTADIVDGVWFEPLWDLEQGGNGKYDGGMFYCCYNLTKFHTDLPSLTDAHAMFQSCNELTTFSSDLSSLTNSEIMFSDCAKLASFTSNLPSLTSGRQMFDSCYKLASFSSDLSNMTDGWGMFKKCINLQTFSSDLPNLTDGQLMFKECSNLTSFDIDLPSLLYGMEMFRGCSNLTSFDNDLSSLKKSNEMFRGCSNLKSFSSDLRTVTSTQYMFEGCINLTSFTSNLSSLTYRNKMFSSCKLDAPSVKNIIDTINTSNNALTLGMGCDNTETDKNIFAQEVGYTDMASLLAVLKNKGGVAAQYNGRPITTYSLRRPSEDTLPVFVKLEELKKEEKYVDYTSLDGSKKFRLDWFHETTGSTEGYTQFNSLEEAIEHFNIKPIERN